ncbi:Cell wall protein PGA30 [Candida viswanathii]|uniref:Cell wall protein PGA30 n=1 Tax=Candida viswanathii TaxID=5486 RepID=A0A367XTY5_9ASCO|nr:Cell wall protein PGA30 [Candida viswanathii]
MRSNFLIVAFLCFFTPVFCCLNDIYLYVKSNDKRINGWGLYYVKEDDGVNYFFLGSNRAKKLIYDDKNKYIYNQPNARTKWYYLINKNFLQISNGKPYKVNIKKDGELDFSGDDNLWAVKEVKDPVNYSKNHYAIVYYKNRKDVPKDAIKVKVYSKKV